MDMKDPDAAKFLWVPVVEANGSAAYCGFVNGKNSYGGYTGYHPFMVRVAPDAKQPVTGASVIGFSTGPDEYGLDPIAGSCSHFGYGRFVSTAPNITANEHGNFSAACCRHHNVTVPSEGYQQPPTTRPS